MHPREGPKCEFSWDRNATKRIYLTAGPFKSRCVGVMLLIKVLLFNSSMKTDVSCGAEAFRNPFTPKNLARTSCIGEFLSKTRRQNEREGEHDT